MRIYLRLESSGDGLGDQHSEDRRAVGARRLGEGCRWQARQVHALRQAWRPDRGPASQGAIVRRRAVGRQERRLEIGAQQCPTMLAFSTARRMCGAFGCPMLPGATAAVPRQRRQLPTRSAPCASSHRIRRPGGSRSSPRGACRRLSPTRRSGFDAAAGESIVMVPLILDRGRPVKANISLDAGLLEAIDDEAVRRGLTRSGFLASARSRHDRGGRGHWASKGPASR